MATVPEECQKVIFQQDYSYELLRRETPQFISPDMWPANSPDLNPVNYCIWGMMQERLYQVPIQDVDQLWQRLVETWDGLQHSVVDEAIDQWRKRPEACVHAQGGHFELSL